MQLNSMPLRLAFRADTTAAALDTRTSNTPRCWRGTDVSLQIAALWGSQPLDLSNVASLTIEMRSARNPGADALLVKKTITAEDITAIVSAEDWLSGAAQHASIELSAAETNQVIEANNERQVWLVLSGVTATGASVTYGFTYLTLAEDGTGDGEAAPPAPVDEYYTKIQTAAIVHSNLERGIARKPNASASAFTRTAVGVVSVLAGTRFVVAGVVIDIVADTPVTMPVHEVGTDYAIYACADGAIVASANFSAPAGYTVENSLNVGGYHYAPGGCAAAQAGGDTTPQINPYSIWDLRHRPSCPDPRGMAFVSESVGWVDIYLLGVDHELNGTSRFGVTIADGGSLPKVPTSRGGDGSATYTRCDWWNCAEIAAAHGKGLLSIADFQAAAFGVTERTSVGADPGSTGLDAPRTSRFGLMQASGVMWAWSNELKSEGGASYTWRGDTASRGSMYMGSDPKAVLLGGGWVDGANCGSRASNWGDASWSSHVCFGARCRSDHLKLV